MAFFGHVAQRLRQRLSWLMLGIGLLALFPLHDSQPGAAQSAFNYAWALFLHGELAKCQVESARDAAQFEISDPAWAVQLKLLQAQALLWRGLNADALRTLSEVVTTDPNNVLQKLTIEASVYTKRGQFPDASQDLRQASRLCEGADYPACGSVARDLGVLAIDRGEVDEARRHFLDSLSYARGHNDRFQSATALLNLSAVALQSGHADEAVDWSKAARRAALEIDARELVQAASGNLGYAYFDLGDRDQALELFLRAREEAAKLGSLRVELKWLENIGLVYESNGESARAVPFYQEALELARKLDSKLDVIISIEDLAFAAIDAGRLDEADAYLGQLAPLTRASGNPFHKLVVVLARAKVAAARHQGDAAEGLLRKVDLDPAAPMLFKIEAEWNLAELYEAEGKVVASDSMYRKSLATFESARAKLKDEESRLPFLANADSVYSSYIHFLTTRRRFEEALIVADQSRAQTLLEGLGILESASRRNAAHLAPAVIAAKTHATVLFYWLGKSESYLWAITPRKSSFFLLPSQQKITGTIDRYQKSLVEARDPIAENNQDGRDLYTVLVKPAIHMIRPGSRVVICADGALSKLNFETLVVPGPGPDSHYWIEDAEVVVAPSLSMLAATGEAKVRQKNLLIMGDAVSADPEYPKLPLASLEIRLVGQHFAPSERRVLTGSEATPDSYLSIRPEDYTYIHFVAHGIASQADPLESAIVLSRGPSLDGAFKLYGYQILQHKIGAELVTISACNGSGTRAYSGEGLVGLSWSFLHSGAHNAIGALWNVSDESTPRTMNRLYDGIENGLDPSAALRDAKLDLVRSAGEFHKPFYWAPFQLYRGR